MTREEWADRLEKIAAAINHTVYNHELAMSKYDRQRKVRYDDADDLSVELRHRGHAVSDRARRSARGRHPTGRAGLR